MSKFKIEKVEHNFISMLIHECCIVDYVKKYDKLCQYNYSSEENAKKDKDNNTVGMWRIKSFKKKQLINQIKNCKNGIFRNAG